MMKTKYLLIPLVFYSLGISQEILFISPNQSYPDTWDLQVTLIGENTNWYDPYATPSVSFSGSGIDVNSVNPVSSTELTVQIDIHSWANIGLRDVTVSSDEGDSVTDYDGNVYQTVEIGERVWMKENLKVTHYNDGSEIPTGYSNDDWANLSTGASAVYNDNPANADTYGYLYNWYAVEDDRGVCPEGWNVPTENEYTELTDYLGGLSEQEEK